MRTNYFNSQGHLDDNWIGFFVEKTIEKKESDVPTEIIEHIENCFLCKSNAVELMNLLTFFEKEKEIEANFSDSGAVLSLEKPEKKPFRYYLMRVAALISILITVGMLGFYLVNNHANTDLKGEEYSVNKLLEQEINSITRNEENLNITIVSPEKDEVFDEDDKITIRWKSIENNLKYDLVIFDNKDNEVIQANQVSGNEYQVAQNLKKGIYYYRIYAGTIQATGKFYIK